MTKEDKQIINRAIKEEWRIGDRSRLKRLLEKNLKLYRENVELENENEEMKKGLGCETCRIHLEYMGLNDKINKLEKENRLLGERCNQLLKDKGDLTDKCKSLEEENNKLLDVINNQDVKIADLEKQIEEYKNGNFVQTVNQIIEGKDKRLEQATEIIKSLIALHYNPVVTKDDLKKQDKILEQAEQFLKGE